MPRVNARHFIVMMTLRYVTSELSSHRYISFIGFLMLLLAGVFSPFISNFYFPKDPGGRQIPVSPPAPMDSNKSKWNSRRN
jgi:hypothetical protein